MTRKNLRLVFSPKISNGVYQTGNFLRQRKDSSGIIDIMATKDPDDIRLKQESEQLNLVLSLMGEGLVVVHSGGAIAHINQAAGVLVRVAPADAVGELFVTVFPVVYDAGNGEEGYMPIREALDQDTIIRIRLVDNTYIKLRDGSRFPVSMTITPFVSGRQRYAIVLMQDITQEKAIDRAKTDFVSLASHQLKTPLSAINWFTEMVLTGDAGRLKKKQREYLEEVAHSAKRMTQLVNELLNVSRLELGTFIIEPEPATLSNIMRETIREFAPKIRDKRLSVIEQYDPNVPKIKVDTTLTGMIFQNLISNAVKYTPTGGEIRVHIGIEDQDVVITVADNGFGIPEDQHNQIFTKFFRADNAVSGDSEGTGLGLYLIRSIVEEAKGTITFTSREGKGATFRVTIPLSGMPLKRGSRRLS